MPFRVNGEGFTVAESAAQRAAVHVSFEVEGDASAEYRWTESGQADPAGRYRIRVEDDAMVFQRAASANWGTATDLIEFNADEATFHIPFDLTGVAGLVASITEVVGLETPQVVWLGGGHGPTEIPAAYLAVEVTGQGTLYLPMWR